jgi:hypothetical protein
MILQRLQEIDSTDSELLNITQILVKDTKTMIRFCGIIDIKSHNPGDVREGAKKRNRKVDKPECMLACIF